MGQDSEQTTKNFKNHLKKNIASQEFLKSRIEDENSDVTNPTEDNYSLFNKTGALTDGGITAAEGRSCSHEEKDLPSCSEEDPEEAEKESARAFNELVAVLQDKDIPLGVLEEPQVKDWLEKYTGIYRTSWHR
ncbi:AVB_G0036490.mRNA.1.CDS.1 [Saccharomyces cerevisiae]|nr:AVB_G0036490.mRNA.1.CDS.1 [Saccharomyces cerevisiae]CAI7267290.1 AVB_G0036490.mRNA.1.CDS.1 [Saccharomyces cerevisiae]